jgi:hypothetical protein
MFAPTTSAADFLSASQAAFSAAAWSLSVPVSSRDFAHYPAAPPADDVARRPAIRCAPLEKIPGRLLGDPQDAANLRSI